jgi:hypothetical protein
MSTGPISEEHSSSPQLIKSPSPALGAILLLSSVAVLVGGIVAFGIAVPRHTNLVSLQWAGSWSSAQKLVGSHVGRFRSALWWDIFLLIPTYTVGLLLGCVLGRKVFCTTTASQWSFYGIVAAGLAAALNLAQDILLLAGLDSMKGVWVFRVAATASLLKFSALLVVAPIAVGALSTTAVRLVNHPSTFRRSGQALAATKKNSGIQQASNGRARLVAYWRYVKVAFHAEGNPDYDEQLLFGTGPSKGCSPMVIPPPPVEWNRPRPKSRPFLLDRSISRSWWLDRTGDAATAHFAQDSSLPEDVGRGGIGICLSGGGIRSATVALGALQGLRSDQPLGDVAELVSVSGGGYMAGGFQLALSDKCGDDAPDIDGSNVFCPGSVEEDHLRRHSSYLSDGPGQWVVGLAVIFRNLLASLAVIGLTVTTLGMGIAQFYRRVPVVNGGFETLKIAPLAAHGTHAPGYPGVHWPVVLGVVSVAGLAIVLYVIELFWTAVAGSRPMGISRTAVAVTWAAVIVGAVGVIIPTLVWVSSWVTYHVGFTSRPAVAAGSLSAITSFVGALAATLWRKKQRVGSIFTVGQRAVKGVLPNSMVQVLIIWIALLVLVLAALLTAGWVATTGLDESWWALAVIIPLALLAGFLDQTSMSLHPFYRRRLASAFAVRRGDSGGIPVAQPYDYQKEGTPLSKYARQRKRFPRVTFAAAANITGQDRTPPGRRSVSFALGAKYVGGPQVGWVRTDFLEELSGTTIGHDLTVESAMAISGAAFASAMGAQTRFYELFLSLVNLRLGAWLPNPYYVALKASRPHDWTIPGLPRIRRLDYFAREIFGIHPSKGRMLLCTDGGHYENLGLVELLRRRPSLIYCFDASGASPPLAGTLSQAITLAREELGVEIDLNHPYTLVPGGSQPLQPAGPLAPIEAKLSEDAVITGTIRYPCEQDTEAPAEGTLIYANTTLTPSMPYELLQFALPDPGFPNDGTADQWFDVSRFDAYKRLGFYLGCQVVEMR